MEGIRKHMSPTTPTTAMPKLFVHAGVRRQPDGTVVYFDAAKRIGDVFVSCGISADWLFPNDMLSPLPADPWYPANRKWLPIEEVAW